MSYIADFFIQSGANWDEIFVLGAIGLCIFFGLVFGVAGIVDEIKRRFDGRNKTDR